MRVRMKAASRAVVLAVLGALLLMTAAFAPRQALAETTASISYRAKVKGSGWQAWKRDGKAAGSNKASKRLEGLKVTLSGEPGGVTYRIRQQSKKWQGWKSNGAQAAVKKGKRIDAVQIKLTGAAADAYDVYYRVNVQNVGWMGWAKNGASAGATGFKYGIKGIQVKLVEKGGEQPPAKVSGKSQKYLLAHIKYSGSKYKSLKKLGIKGYNYDATANKLVNQEMDQMIEFTRRYGGASFKSLSQYEKSVVILTYVGMTYGYKDGSTNVKSMILKRGGTCFGISDLILCLGRKAGIKQAYLTKPGRNVDHWYNGMMHMYASQHRTVVCKIGGKWYELDGNSAMFTAPYSGREEPERITASYAKYLRGKSKKFSKINP